MIDLKGRGCASGRALSIFASIDMLAYDTVGNVTSVDGPQSGTADQTLAAYNAARQLVWQIGPDPDVGGPALFPAVEFRYLSDGQVDYVQSGTVTVQSQAGMSSFSELQRQTATYDSYHRPIRQALSSAGTAHREIGDRFRPTATPRRPLNRMAPTE